MSHISTQPFTKSQKHSSISLEHQSMESITIKISPTTNSAGTGLTLKETELTLGLPGDSRAPIGGVKRGYEQEDKDSADDHSDTEVTSAAAVKSPVSKTQVVGWPPLRPSRRQAMMKRCTYVKVAVDGAPYLRKVDLELYTSYRRLLVALQEMFTCFTIGNGMDEDKLMDPVNGTEYVPTYEDKDGDWMLVGDVPWKMFTSSCKRLRLMKNSEAVGLAPKTPRRSTSTS